MAVFWVAAPCRGEKASSTMVSFYQTTGRYNTEDSHRRENLQSYLETWSLNQFLPERATYKFNATLYGNNTVYFLGIRLEMRHFGTENARQSTSI
jgi:hypothetical protein